jgi:hypothetical protein
MVSTFRLCLVHWNSDFLGIGMGISTNTRSLNEMIIFIFSFGDNTGMTKFFNWSRIIFFPNFLKYPNFKNYFSKSLIYLFIFEEETIKWVAQPHPNWHKGWLATHHDHPCLAQGVVSHLWKRFLSFFFNKKLKKKKTRFLLEKIKIRTILLLGNSYS